MRPARIAWKQLSSGLLMKLDGDDGDVGGCNFDGRYLVPLVNKGFQVAANPSRLHTVLD